MPSDAIKLPLLVPVNDSGIGLAANCLRLDQTKLTAEEHKKKMVKHNDRIDAIIATTKRI